MSDSCYCICPSSESIDDESNSGLHWTKFLGVIYLGAAICIPTACVAIWLVCKKKKKKIPTISINPAVSSLSELSDAPIYVLSDETEN